MFIDEPILLVDADSIFFRAAYVVFDRKKEKLKVNWKKDVRKIIDQTMRSIQAEFSSNIFKVGIKGRNNFRKDIYSKYKTNRPDLHEDMKTALTYGHEHMKDKYDAVESEGMEADDLVSIWAHEAREMDLPYVVVGIDKDLLQIPGDHYNFVKCERQTISEDVGNYKLMIQCLTGDNTDNIPGIKGIGPKKAEKILAGVPKYRRWNRVKAAWRQHRAGNPYLSRALLEMLTSFDEEKVRRDKFK